VDASADGTHIAYAHSSGFYFSFDSGNTFTQFSTIPSSFLATSQNSKLTLTVPTSVTDTIYTFYTNMRLTFNADMYLPKNRLVLQSNSITDYGDNTSVFYPFRTQFLSLDVNDQIILNFPLYENYVLYPNTNSNIFLPEITERSLGIKITFVKLTAHALNFIVESPNVIYGFGDHTPHFPDLPGTGIGNNTTAVTLLSSYSTSVAASYAWVVISAP
jgi:hypothetical protein